MFAYGIFKVIYAPQKAFKEIIQNPKYIGPIIILILFTIANIGSVYMAASKTYVEQTTPTAEQLDMWTEGKTFWTQTSMVNISENFNDYINGTYYGNKSIEFSTVNNNQISMRLNFTENVNCSNPNGYKNLYLRTKLLSPEDKPENVTLYLFSTNSSDYFYYNMTNSFANVTNNVWNNLTILLNNESWLNNSANANWESISGLALNATWPSNQNITVLVDGIFFGGTFKLYVENVTGYMVNFSLVSFMQFILRWVLLGGLIYVMARAFKVKTVWRPLLILMGFALVTMFIQATINVATYSTLPNLYYRFSFLGGVNGEPQIAYNEIVEKTWLVSQITSYLQMITFVWTVILCTIATRLLTEFPWTRSLLISVASFFVATTVEGLILGL